MLFERKNPTDELNMLDKSLELLKERYEKKQITIEVFSKKCTEIGKKKEKLQKKLNKIHKERY